MRRITLPTTPLRELTPVLDEAINQLGVRDRTAILLRFFERRDLGSIGQAMGSSENAAQKRVSRALEKLHLLLKHRGVTLSAGALATALAGETVAAAPTGLAGSIAGTALASAAAGSGTTLTLFKILTMTTPQKALIATVLVARRRWHLRNPSGIDPATRVRNLEQTQGRTAHKMSG